MYMYLELVRQFNLVVPTTKDNLNKMISTMNTFARFDTISEHRTITVLSNIQVLHIFNGYRFFLIIIYIPQCNKQGSHPLNVADIRSLIAWHG